MSINKNFNIGDETYNITEFENSDAISMLSFNNNYDEIIAAFENIDETAEEAKKNAANATATANNVETKLTADETTIKNNTSRISKIETANLVAKSAMTVQCITNIETITQTDMKINCKNPSATGTLLTASNGGIKTGEGVTSVLVGGRFFIKNAKPGDRFRVAICGDDINTVYYTAWVNAPIVGMTVKKTTKKINVPESAKPLNIDKTDDEIYVARKSGGEVTKKISPVLGVTIDMEKQSVLTDVSIETSTATDISLVIPTRLIKLTAGTTIYAYVKNATANRGKIVGDSNNYFTVVAI